LQLSLQELSSREIRRHRHRRSLRAGAERLREQDMNDDDEYGETGG
jgi:hypothetical protein